MRRRIPPRRAPRSPWRVTPTYEQGAEPWTGLDSVAPRKNVALTALEKQAVPSRGMIDPRNAEIMARMGCCILVTMAKDALTHLSELIAAGLPASDGGVRSAIEALFGDRYPKKYLKPTTIRDAYALATEGEEGVPYAGLINEDNTPSGPYGGTSIVWFPTREAGSLIDFGVGTRGLAPDEGILTRPGHRRRLGALARYLARQGIDTWVKPDPRALDVGVPKAARDRFPGFDHVFRRYGQELYACACVPRKPDAARLVVQAFIDLYAFERGWPPMKAHEEEYNRLHAALREDLFSTPSSEQVHDLLRHRRFVVLQGPPGTGKTRMAEEIQRRHFGGRGMTVQFHPAVTYEDFVVGLSPSARDTSLRFEVRPGWLLEAVRQAKEAPFLMVVDEINRADLGKVLGEAIYLFEAADVVSDRPRRVRLPHPVDGHHELTIPDGLYVLATMNTADRSIAAMDLAVRRRFAFVTIHPDRTAIAARGIEAAVHAFDMVADVFVEHAPGDGLHLLPGHAYFLVKDEAELRERLHYEVIPLLDEYLQQGVLGAASVELHSVRDTLERLASGERGIA